MPPDDLPEAAVLAQVEHARRLTTPQSEPPARSRPAATPLPTARTDNPRSSNPRTGWAAAFADVAQEVAASLPFLPPEERRTAKIRAAALSSTASTLIAGTHPPSLEP